MTASDHVPAPQSDVQSTSSGPPVAGSHVQISSTETVQSSSPLSSRLPSSPEACSRLRCEPLQLGLQPQTATATASPASLDLHITSATNLANIPLLEEGMKIAGEKIKAKKPDRATKQQEAKAIPSKVTKQVKLKAKPSTAASAAAKDRPTRNRQTPKRFGAEEESKNATSPKATKASRSLKAPSKIFDPVFITTNSTSRLTKADCYRLLLEEAAWTSLSAEQQKELVTMLPLGSIGEESVSKRPKSFTLSNNCFRTDVAKFQTDLTNGHLAKTWQAAAEQAMEERAAGQYDAWKNDEAELWWGQKGR